MMVFNMLQAELEAEQNEKFLKLAVWAFTPHLASKSVRDTYEDWHSKLLYTIRKSEYSNEVYKSQQDKLREFAEQAGKTFAHLKNTGALEAFDKLASEIHNSLQQN